MHTVFVLVLVFWFKGGLILSKNVVADTKVDCEIALPLIVKEYKDQYKDTLEYISATCEKKSPGGDA